MRSENIAVPFLLKVPPTVEMENNTTVFTTEYSFYGVARLKGPFLSLEWSGNIKFVQNRGISVKLWTETAPVRVLEIPLLQLLQVQVVGRWFRVRLEFQVSDLQTVADFPGAKQGRVFLWLKRKDRNIAKELVNQIQFESADLLLQEAEAQPIGLLEGKKSSRPLS